MAPGPPKKPSTQEKLEGNPGHRVVNHDEPRPAGEPVAPIWLSDAGRVVWGRVIESMGGSGVHTQADENVLAMYCESVADFVFLTTQLLVEGETLTSRLGGIKRNPASVARNEARSAVLRFAGELGLTPSARTKLHAVGASEKDEIQGFLDEAFDD